MIRDAPDSIALATSSPATRPRSVARYRTSFRAAVAATYERATAAVPSPGSRRHPARAPGLDALRGQPIDQLIDSTREFFVLGSLPRRRPDAVMMDLELRKPTGRGCFSQSEAEDDTTKRSSE